MRNFSISISFLIAIFLNMSLDFCDCSLNAQQAKTAPTSSAKIDFENDVIPVLTKVGCNAGKCHGAAIGRGGFKLSLFGGNPQSDFEAIVRQQKGRRVNLSKPDSSLLILKPTEQMEHGGGSVLDLDEENTQILLDWIEQGTPQKTERTLIRVQIDPARTILDSVGQTVPLKATAFFSDETEKEVTRRTVFTAEDPASVQIISGDMEMAQ